MTKFSWMEYAEQYLAEDYSLVKNIIAEDNANEERVLTAIYSQHDYVTNKEALYILGEEFKNDAWVNKNKDRIVNKINSLDEHEIKIIINAQDKSSTPQQLSGDVTPAEVEYEGVKKRGRGRPKKNVIVEPAEKEEVLECDGECSGLKYNVFGYDSEEPLGVVTGKTSRDCINKATEEYGQEVWIEKIKESVDMEECNTPKKIVKEDSNEEETDEEESDDVESEDETSEEESDEEEMDIDWEYVEDALKNLIDDQKEDSEETGETEEEVEPAEKEEVLDEMNEEAKKWVNPNEVITIIRDDEYEGAEGTSNREKFERFESNFESELQSFRKKLIALGYKKDIVDKNVYIGRTVGQDYGGYLGHVIYLKLNIDTTPFKMEDIADVWYSRFEVGGPVQHNMIPYVDGFNDYVKDRQAKKAAEKARWTGELAKRITSNGWVIKYKPRSYDSSDLKYYSEKIKENLSKYDMTPYGINVRLDYKTDRGNGPSDWGPSNYDHTIRIEGRHDDDAEKMIKLVKDIWPKNKFTISSIDYKNDVDIDKL